MSARSLAATWFITLALTPSPAGTGPASNGASMLAHHTYPKDAPESRAVRSAFICAGFLICLIVTLISVDIAIRNGFATFNARKAPEMKSAFMQPKPMGSIFQKTQNNRVVQSTGSDCEVAECALHFE